MEEAKNVAVITKTSPARFEGRDLNEFMDFAD